MTNIRCEDYERGYADLAETATDSIRRQALADHAQSCPYCRNFGAQALRLRAAMSSLPRLDVSPQFIYNLRRAIHRLERAETGFGRDFAPKAYPLALSAGFAMALLLGFLFLRPGYQPGGIGGMQPTALTAATGAQVQGPAAQPIRERQMTPVSTQEALIAQDAGTDTARHRLPEAPGKEKIPIPVEDDLWRLNQVSTTPASP